MLLCCITLSSSRENQRSAQEVARRIFGAVAGEIYAQVKTYQVPITNLSPSHLHYLLFASRFPLPHFTLAVLFALSFPISTSLSRLHFFLCLSVCLCVGLLVAMAQDNTKLCDFSNTNNNDFLSTPIATWGSPGLGGVRIAELSPLVGLLDYEDTRLKTSSRVRMDFPWRGRQAWRYGYVDLLPL